mgnify:FL=1|jgi:hypothetical protein
MPMTSLAGYGYCVIGFVRSGASMAQLASGMGAAKATTCRWWNRHMVYAGNKEGGFKIADSGNMLQISLGLLGG